MQPIFIHGGGLLRVRYCYTCKLIRPLRTSHCHSCNQCVQRFDHHCIWLGKCIGRDNYRVFFALVSTLALLILTTFGISVQSIWYKFDQGKGLSTIPIFIYGVIAIGIGAFDLSLLAFHCYLVTKNLTTNEQLKGTYKNNPNPFDQFSWRKNIHKVLFAKVKKNRNSYQLKKSSKVASLPPTPPRLDDSFKVELDKKFPTQGDDHGLVQNKFKWSTIEHGTKRSPDKENTRMGSVSKIAISTKGPSEFKLRQERSLVNRVDRDLLAVDEAEYQHRLSQQEIASLKNQRRDTESVNELSEEPIDSPFFVQGRFLPSPNKLPEENYDLDDNLKYNDDSITSQDKLIGFNINSKITVPAGMGSIMERDEVEANKVNAFGLQEPSFETSIYNPFNSGSQIKETKFSSLDQKGDKKLFPKKQILINHKKWDSTNVTSHEQTDQLTPVHYFQVGLRNQPNIDHRDYRAQDFMIKKNRPSEFEIQTPQNESNDAYGNFVATHEHLYQSHKQLEPNRVNPLPSVININRKSLHSIGESLSEKRSIFDVSEHASSHAGMNFKGTPNYNGAMKKARSVRYNENHLGPDNIFLGSKLSSAESLKGNAFGLHVDSKKTDYMSRNVHNKKHLTSIEQALHPISEQVSLKATKLNRKKRTNHNGDEFEFPSLHYDED